MSNFSAYFAYCKRSHQLKSVKSIVQILYIIIRSRKGKGNNKNFCCSDAEVRCGRQFFTNTLPFNYNCYSCLSVRPKIISLMCHTHLLLMWDLWVGLDNRHALKLLLWHYSNWHLECQLTDLKGIFFGMCITWLHLAEISLKAKVWFGLSQTHLYS